MLSIIAAVSKNGVIGSNGSIPWRIPEDLHFFKTITIGKAVIMGRKTFESIGHPLSQRQNIVISATKRFYAENCITVQSFEEALSYSFHQDAFVIGGYSVYKNALPYAEQIYLTEIEAFFDGDTFFPYFDRSRYHKTILPKKQELLHYHTPEYEHSLYTRKIMNAESGYTAFQHMVLSEL